MKRVLKPLCLAMTAIFLSGCGGQKVTTLSVIDGDGIPKDTKANLKCVFWDQMQQNQINAAIEGFNKIYPNIKVEVQYMGWDDYWTKLEAAATAENMPDVIAMHTNQIAKYVNYDKVAELSEEDMKRYDSTFSYDNYLSGITKLYKYYGKNYGVPKDFSCVVLVYNKKLFDDAGEPYPTADWTWSDLEETAARMTDKQKGIYGFGAYNSVEENIGDFIYQNGGYIVDEQAGRSGYDDPKSIEAMEFYLNLQRNYSPSMDAFTQTDSKILFTSGTIAMMYFGNWTLSLLYDNEDFMSKYGYGMVPLPSSDDGKKATIMNGLAWSLPTSAKNPDAAKQLIAYFGSEQGQKDTAIGPSIPPYNGVVYDWAELNKDLLDPNAVIEQIPYGVQFAATESKTQWEIVQNKYFSQIFANQISVEDGFKQLAKEMNEILNKEKAKDAKRQADKK